MKPYSPKPSGSQKGRTSLTSKGPTRSRALKRDKVAARREGKVLGPADAGYTETLPNGTIMTVLVSRGHDPYPFHGIIAGDVCLCRQCCDDRDNGRI